MTAAYFMYKSRGGGAGRLRIPARGPPAGCKSARGPAMTSGDARAEGAPFATESGTPPPLRCCIIIYEEDVDESHRESSAYRPNMPVYCVRLCQFGEPLSLKKAD